MTDRDYGIAAIGSYDPGAAELCLPNSWFESRGVIGRKFLAHTGILTRGISFLSEPEMAARAIESLKHQTDVDFRDCGGVLLSSSSLVPVEQSDWRRDCLKALGRWEDLHRFIGPAVGLSEELLRGLEWSDELRDWDAICRLARQIGMSDGQIAAIEQHCLAEFGSIEATTAAVARKLAISPERVRGVNWGCSGYVRAWELLETELIDRARPAREMFFLLITVSRTSKFTDFGASDTGALFGDFATATLVTHRDNARLPPRLLLRHSSTALPRTRDLSPDAALLGEALFDYERRSNVLTPTPDGGAIRVDERLCWTMDGFGVVYAAEPAMTGAIAAALDATRIKAADVQWLLGHQPGRKVMERAAGGLRGQGYRGRIPVDLMARTGNITCSSIPHVLAMHWNELEGLVICPAIGMHAPASPFMSQGCLVFEASPVSKHLPLAGAPAVYVANSLPATS